MLRRESDADDIGTESGGGHDNGAADQDELMQTAACQQSMATLISDEIIPRLVAAHRPCEPRKPDPVDVLIALEPATLADLAVTADAGRLTDIAEAALEGGLPYDTLLLEVLAPTARLLGTRWEDDQADFVEVTLGLWRLQEVVHELASRRLGPDEAPPPSPERRVLCAVAPGDDHSFGSLMLEDLFRRGGWSTTGVRGANRSELLGTVRQNWFDIIALTVSVEESATVLSQLVAELRATSRNPGVSIMVGGLVFAEQPELAAIIGADATAVDARAALKKAEVLVGQVLVEQHIGSSGAQRRAGARSN